MNSGSNVVDDPRYTKLPPVILRDLDPISKTEEEIRYDKITTRSDPNYGCYRRTPVRNLDRRGVVYTKAYFPKKLRGPYDHYLPWFQGFYYIPRDDQIPIRRQIYGLMNNKMPTSGNTELYNKKFRDIRVPKDFCPLIDPCPHDWCKDCAELRKRPSRDWDLASPLNISFVYLFFIAIIAICGILTFV
jgi:hypothetical protein